MSVHAIAGLVVLNLLLLVAGAGALWAIRGWGSWIEFVRLAGLAYLLGVAVVGTVLVLELTIRVPFGLATVVVTAFAIAVAGVVVGRVLRRSRPPIRGARPDAARRPAIVHALGAAVAIVYLEALFRSARLSELSDWDSMAFWVPKAKAIYYFGGLDHQFFTSLPGASYPPLVPALDAAAFEFMGSADSVTLHLMFWFLFAGFIAAVAGVLVPRVHPLVLWPCLLFVALTPVFVAHAASPLGDLLLDYFLALAILLVALWLVEGQRWPLVLAAFFLVGAMVTKREGLLLAACVVVSGIAASWRRRRSTWPALVLVAALAFAATLPWRVWFTTNGIGGEGPGAGYLGFTKNLSRAWPSVRLTLEVLFNGNFWLGVPIVLLVAIATGLVIRAHVLPAFAGWYFVLATLGASWVTLSFPSMPITTNGALNPIVRLSGGIVVPAAGLLPLLLTAAWRSATAGDER